MVVVSAEGDDEGVAKTQTTMETMAEHTGGKLSSSSEALGTGLFSKLIFFGLIVGAIAIFLKTRKGGSVMSEKSFA